MGAQQCEHLKDDGDQCGMTTNIDPATGLCVWHDPARKAEADVMRERGGRIAGARAKARTPKVRVVAEREAPPPPKTLEDALTWSSWAVWAVTTGKIDGRTGHEIGYILRAFMDGRKHLDATDQRVKELEAKLRKLRQVTEADQ